MTLSLFEPPYYNGTHFSDGVRVGPIFGTAYAPGAPGGNFTTPLRLASPSDTISANGILVGPVVNSILTPYGYHTDANYNSSVCLRKAAAITSAGFLTLLNTDMGETGCARVVLSSPVTLRKGAISKVVTQGFVFDVPRCVMLTGDGTLRTQDAYAYGYDAYGFPVVSAIKTMVAAGYQIFPKAMKVLLGIFVNGDTGAGSIAVGISDILGLPYRINNKSLLTAMWCGLPHASTTAEVGTAINIAGAQSLLFDEKTNLITADSKIPEKPQDQAYSNDVRGLIALPGSKCNTALTNPDKNSNFQYEKGAPSLANQLVLTMYLPDANPIKPGIYTNASQYAGKTFPSGIQSIQDKVGKMALEPSSIGGKLCYVPEYADTVPEDLYGVPQYNTDVPGIPFSCN